MQQLVSAAANAPSEKTAPLDTTPPDAKDGKDAKSDSSSISAAETGVTDSAFELLLDSGAFDAPKGPRTVDGVNAALLDQRAKYQSSATSLTGLADLSTSQSTSSTDSSDSCYNYRHVTRSAALMSVLAGRAAVD